MSEHPREAVEAVARALSAAVTPTAWGYWTDSANAVLDQIAPILTAQAEAKLTSLLYAIAETEGDLRAAIAAVAAERERCAKLCEENEAGMMYGSIRGWALAPRSGASGTHPGDAYAAAIRAMP